MVNYSNSKIYKIVPTNGDDICYIGSTTKQYLSQRMDSHRNDYKKWKKDESKNMTKITELFEKYGVENCKILLIENFPCNSKEELDNKTNDYINCLNTINNYISKCEDKIKDLEVQKKLLETETEDDRSINTVSSDGNPMDYLLEEPTDEYLINIRAVFMKYKNRYEKIDKNLMWNEKNKDVDIEKYKSKFWINMSYILTDIKDLHAKPIDS